MTTGRAGSGSRMRAARRVVGAGWAMLLLAPGAQAQDLSRFEACVGPELDARARLMAYGAPCMADASCLLDPEEEADAWRSVVEAQGATRQVEDRIGSADGVACLAAFAAQLEREAGR